MCECICVWMCAIVVLSFLATAHIRQTIQTSERKRFRVESISVVVDFFPVGLELRKRYTREWSWIVREVFAQRYEDGRDRPRLCAILKVHRANGIYEKRAGTAPRSEWNTLFVGGGASGTDERKGSKRRNLFDAPPASISIIFLHLLN